MMFCDFDRQLCAACRSFEVVVAAPKSSRSFNCAKEWQLPRLRMSSTGASELARGKRRSRRDASGAAETERACTRGCHCLSKRYRTEPLRTTRKDAEPTPASATAFLKAVAAMVAIRRIMRFRDGLSLPSV